jgi:hypothetical protein
VRHTYSLARILRLHHVRPVDLTGEADDDIWFVGSTAAGENARYGLFAEGKRPVGKPPGTPRPQPRPKRGYKSRVAQRNSAGTERAEDGHPATSSQVGAASRYVVADRSSLTAAAATSGGKARLHTDDGAD